MAIIKNLQTINAGKGEEKRESSDLVGGTVNWHSHYGERYGCSFKNLELSYDPAIPLLGIYPEKDMSKRIHAPQFNIILYKRNTNQNHNEYHLVRMAIIKKSTNNKY